MRPRAARRCPIGVAVVLGALLAAADGSARAEAPYAEPALERGSASAPALAPGRGCTVPADGAPADCDMPEAAGRDPEPADGLEEAAERILDYRTRIVVGADGQLTVSETIAVVSAGDQIKRGIYRDFPTEYSRTLTIGAVSLPILRSQVPFDVVQVQRDGRAEPYHTEHQDNGVRVYAGDADVTLPPGRYTYALTYTTAQLGFFADHDELYWNVTGNGWRFPIDHAAATVVLPAEIPRDRVRLEGYTGLTGSTNRDLTASIDRRSGDLEFATTMALDRYAGLTIVASFPTGFIRAPTSAQRRAELLRANPILMIGPIGVLLVVLYYVGAWLLVGRDPARGTIIPLFEPPLGLDAASLRFVGGMGYDERCFTAALVGLAVKGWARIADADGTYTLSSWGARHTPLGAGERRVNAALLSGQSIELAQKNHSKIRAAISALREALQREYDGKMFRANRAWVVPGLVLSALTILVAGFSGPFSSSFAFGFILVWLTAWTFACFHLATMMWRSWRAALRPGAGAFERIGTGVVAVFTTAFALPFFGGEALGLGVMVQSTTLLMAPVLLLMVGLNFLFYYLLKQPTLAGRQVMDQIEGFKMYLTTVEGAELAHAAPAKTPQLYERLLPYAIALGVENQWATQFGSVLQNAAQRGDGNGYQPAWYSGISFAQFGATQFGSALSSSLSTTISSSATAPGSSSGSSGGGSSGGGEGGGGGGGW